MGPKRLADKEDEKRRSESPAPEDGEKGRVCRLTLLIALLQLLLGVTVIAVAFLMLAISPSLLARETPHWAGIILCVVSIVGLILYCVTYHPDERSSVQFIVKCLYFILCAIGLVISVVAMVFAGHHYSQISSLGCKHVGKDCKCTLDPNDPIARAFTYEAVSDCVEITDTLAMYLLTQIVLNVTQAFVCAFGCFVMWKHRYQVFFAGLQIGSPSPKQWRKV